MLKRAYGNSIAAPRRDLQAIRQRLTIAEVDAATGSARERKNREREGGHEQVVVGGQRSCLTSNWGILTILLATSADNRGVERYGNVSMGV